MRNIHTTIHSDIDTLSDKTIFQRNATRAIALRGRLVLMLYTQRYDDYSLPGGGLDHGEEPISGMIRELQEETGAKNIKDIKEFGIYEEYRPWYKPDFDIQHMISYCYKCTVDKELGDTNLESYEFNNGMKAVWIDINKAIEHNEQTILNSKKKGMSVERETFLLRFIKKDLII